MAARSVYSSSVSSLPPPSPKSPPDYPDLYGKRREIAKIQKLEGEIGFLEDELKSIQSLQPVSISCKEISDFVTANSDPLMPTYRTKHRRYRIWKWLCGLPCSNLSWLCCCSCTGCSVYLEMSRSSHCKPCKFPSCLSCCSMPKCSFFSCPSLSCCRNISCRRLCCFISLPSLSCPPCCSCCECKCNCKCSCKCSFPKCSQVSSCRLCTKSCCNPCSLCCCF
ncbi:guanine nucleotide-binding protein subunit gamma 3-like isoform X1 [Cucurbita pepo subsp. pepo]|uniref:guanine nucleotide-binding protein subunit gamma 3-like isoform X1 n=1 Tax=Cucurbita pepo subsp. pepo TaxID=3664 RepID=UPI000C9DA494|nr:guanine nucleotide-binding protein subunit gamma 3-like isoform X1 [Cucurbita pepo subsp. pepo]XP_023516162.1 guanine nucleotide-binding protein subunit gamma 3-like isoform X1 [Cucurbita pepo subsp. pepo]XP_023516163.1 guanine nucleotide-binding protein subunit gamma 3-like isoform X1 [Cucurbita pepo subsp. pepo]